MKVYFSDIPKEIEIKNAGNIEIVFFRENIKELPSEIGKEYIADEYTLELGYTDNLLERIEQNKSAWLQAAIDLETKKIKDEIRTRREKECFAVINRGELWYDTLTEEQKAELDAWYKAWLDAPETLVIPDRPEWL